MDMCSNISLDFDRILLKQAKDRIIRREPMIERQQVHPDHNAFSCVLQQERIRCVIRVP